MQYATSARGTTEDVAKMISTLNQNHDNQSDIKKNVVFICNQDTKLMLRSNLIHRETNGIFD